MFFLFGFRTSAQHAGVARTACPVCGVPGELPVFRETLKFTLFFIPLIPVKTRYAVQCLNPACFARSRVSTAESRRLVETSSWRS